MDIEYLHLYVKNAWVWRDWFVEKLNFQSVSATSLGKLSELAVQSADILILISSKQTGNPEVQQFLRKHPEGVADVAFRVHNLATVVAQVQKAGGQLIQPIQHQTGSRGNVRWCRIQGWGNISHTLLEYADALIEEEAKAAPPPNALAGMNVQLTNSALPWLSIDHVVLNVPSNELEQAVVWYESQLGFVRQQQFAIATAQSGLRSFVLKHPEGKATLPINEPTSQNSQIQEFLDLNRGSGIQHAALQTDDLVQTVAVLRQRQIPFLSVPATYYEELQTRPGFWQEAGDWSEIAQQQILVDWPPEAPQTRLLQTFMQPLLEQPTFFWELIERQTQITQTGIQRAEGFGAGNFQALFEAIEREQQQRGSL
ncbi:MAG: 4-hydroxyphenylpyruvate dioxygenase [Leptolyngbya sp. SIO1D8]|nr:4-hydroxyphenylpyruvate dioxygenase [Leptolyngbya sp. SIO1D8]